MGLEDLVNEYLAALDALREVEAKITFETVPLQSKVAARARLDNAERDLRAYLA